MFNCY